MCTLTILLFSLNISFFFFTLILNIFVACDVDTTLNKERLEELVIGINNVNRIVFFLDSVLLSLLACRFTQCIKSACDIMK